MAAAWPPAGLDGYTITVATIITIPIYSLIIMMVIIGKMMVVIVVYIIIYNNNNNKSL